MNQRDWALRNATIPIVVIVFTILSVFLGALIGQTDIIDLLAVSLVAAILVYFVWLSQFTWQIALLVCYVGLMYRPIGFQFSSVEITFGLGLLLLATVSWQKRADRMVDLPKDINIAPLRFLLLLWIGYTTIHLLYNMKNPVQPADFTTKNALKSYFEAAAPAVLLFYLSRRPTAITTRQHTLRAISVLMLIGVMINLLITFYRILTHHDIVDPDADLQTMTFLIPGINAVENFYTLRTLGPSAILFGATTLSLKSSRIEVPRFLAISLILAGLLGSVLSGGRAALATSFLLVLATFLLTARIRVFFVTLLVACISVVAINLTSDWLNRSAPIPVSRSLQWVMLSKNKTAAGSIESSTMWRQELFDRAIAEWRSSPRIFWFGRATYGYGVGDYVAAQVYGSWNATQESSLRRGATHNLLTDLLVTVGLVGCVLYYGLVVAILWFLWAAYRSAEVTSEAKSLALICLVSSVAYLSIATFGGGYFPIDTTWLLIVLIALIYREGLKRAKTECEATGDSHLR